MSIEDIIKKYHTELDDVDREMINKNVADKGIEEYLNQQLIYLDCSRILQGMRMMQTIGYPYKREICSYLYVLDKLEAYNTLASNEEVKYYVKCLTDLHQANLEYEKENPPVWYDGKPKKGGKRKPKTKEGDLFPEETKKAKMSKAESKLAAKLLGANLGFGNFKLKKN